MKKVNYYISTLLLSLLFFTGNAFCAYEEGYKEDIAACNAKQKILLDICNEYFFNSVEALEKCVDSAECNTAVCHEEAAVDADFDEDVIDRYIEATDEICGDREDEGPSD